MPFERAVLELDAGALLGLGAEADLDLARLGGVGFRRDGDGLADGPLLGG